MSNLADPHYRLNATALAEWVERQPDAWWSVDGDYRLMSKLDFPCPSDELAPAIRAVGKDIIVRDVEPTSVANGETINADRLDRLMLPMRTHGKKQLVLAWTDPQPHYWVLLEDEELGRK